MELVECTELSKYNAACQALAEAKSVDEVKDYRDKAKAMQVYAMQAKNKTLQADALEITLRAERRLGQLLAESPKNTGRRLEGSHLGGSEKVPPRDTTPTLADMGIDKKLSARSQKIAKIQDVAFDAVVESAREKIFTPKNVHVTKNSGEYEWYTPPEYIMAAKMSMGSINLDPASCAAANKIVKANKFFSKEDNGLIQEWKGTVWLNPPYSQPLITMFSEKLISELPNIKQAIMLVNNATDTAWLQSLMKKSTRICFVEKRIQFVDADGNPGGSPLHGSAFIYFGDKPTTFNVKFSRFGTVLQCAA